MLGGLFCYINICVYLQSESFFFFPCNVDSLMWSGVVGKFLTSSIKC